MKKRILNHRSILQHGSPTNELNEAIERAIRISPSHHPESKESCRHSLIHPVLSFTTDLLELHELCIMHMYSLLVSLIQYVRIYRFSVGWVPDLRKCHSGWDPKHRVSRNNHYGRMDVLMCISFYK